MRHKETLTKLLDTNIKEEHCDVNKDCFFVNNLTL